MLDFISFTVALLPGGRSAKCCGRRRGLPYLLSCPNVSSATPDNSDDFQLVAGLKGSGLPQRAGQDFAIIFNGDKFGIEASLKEKRWQLSTRRAGLGFAIDLEFNLAGGIVHIGLYGARWG